jgi:hypothetical protein
MDVAAMTIVGPDVAAMTDVGPADVAVILRLSIASPATRDAIIALKARSGAGMFA